MKIVDGDSHLIEPLDLFPRYMESVYRERAMCVVNDPTTGKQQMLVDGKPMRLGSDTEEMLSIIVGHGQNSIRIRRAIQRNLAIKWRDAKSCHLIYGFEQLRTPFRWIFAPLLAAASSTARSCTELW